MRDELSFAVSPQTFIPIPSTVIAPLGEASITVVAQRGMRGPYQLRMFARWQSGIGEPYPARDAVTVRDWTIGMNSIATGPGWTPLRHLRIASPGDNPEEGLPVAADDMGQGSQMHMLVANDSHHHPVMVSGSFWGELTEPPCPGPKK